MDKEIIQIAPNPTELYDLVEKVSYRPGWRCWLEESRNRGQGSIGTTLVIVTDTVNSYDFTDPMTVHHYFIVPAASYNRQSWMRWLLDCFLLVEQHECCEFFTIDGVKPFAPNHGPGEDPYQIWVYNTDKQRRTSFQGILNQT